MMLQTYAVDRQTSGSASTGTAIVSGVKVNFGTVGFDANVKRRNCTLVSDNKVRLTTILDWSLAAGAFGF
jgi:alkaline phosphatase